MTAPRFLDFDVDPVTVARRLLGQRLVRVSGGERLSGIIVEVEAYLGVRDKAAHSYGGRRTARNASMYLPGGHAYVYFIYGMHHCVNIVCGGADEPVAVLLRGLEPQEGLQTMYRRRRGARGDHDLCSGPAKLTEALGIDRALDGEDLHRSSRLWIERVRGRALPEARIVRSPRVGIAYAREWSRRRLRFLIQGSPHVSKGR